MVIARSFLNKGVGYNVLSCYPCYCTNQRCAWTRFWIFCTRTPAVSNRIKSVVFFALAGTRLDLDFVFVVKKHTGCLLDFYLSGMK